MRQIKLVGLVLIALFAFGATTALSASAEEPLVLVLPGEKVTELKYSGKGGVSKLEAGGKTIECETVEATTEGFKEFEKKPADANAGTGHLHFLGCKQGGVSCRSETAKEKDAIGIILVLLALLFGSEKTTAGVLQPLLVSTVLGLEAGETELKLNCGGVKEAVKGNVGCLTTPGLTELEPTAKVEIACKIENKKQLTGTCFELKTTCEKLANEPLLGNLGVAFEAAAEEIKIEGNFNKMVTLDD
jgi:hypothetical protein